MEEVQCFYQEDEYYRSECNVEQLSSGVWRLRLNFYRKDSAECVGIVYAMHKLKEVALTKMAEKAEAAWEGLQRPPVEWGRLDIRKLVVDYGEFDYGLTLILCNLSNLLKDGRLTQSELHSQFWDCREKIISGVLDFSKRLIALPEEDRISLMLSDEKYYKDRNDSWGQIDLDARDSLFEFILNPSCQVKDAHELHLRKMMVEPDSGKE